MATWQERITRDTRPSHRAEHELRYLAAAPIVRACSTWADLGCGDGVAAAGALGGEDLGRVVLVDAAPEALDVAGRDLRAREIVRVPADLATDDGVATMREAVGSGADAAVTCFGCIEHLATFAGLVGALTALAEGGATVVLSVPNDAFWSLESPYRQTMWGEGAFEELRRLLPGEATVAAQVPLEGSSVVLDGTQEPIDLPAVTARPDAVPSHLIAAFGPHASLLTSRAHAVGADLDARRRAERQRESDLAVLEAELAQLRAIVNGQPPPADG